MPVPEGYNKKDFQKVQSGGADPFTMTRIKDFCSMFLAHNVPDHEALFVIDKQFGIKLSKSTYSNMKKEIMSNTEVQAWLNSYARIGFVSAHIQDIERTKMMTDKVVASYLMEMSKPHDERDYAMLSQLSRDYVALTKLAVVLRAGAPVLARIKAMIDASNIRAIENDPTMSPEERKEIITKEGRKTATVLTVPNTMTDDNTDVTVVSRLYKDGKTEHEEERGKSVEYEKDGRLKRSKELSTRNPKFKKIFSQEEKESSQKGETSDSEDISGSESGSEFIQFLINESKSDDIIPKRLRSSLKLDSEG